MKKLIFGLMALGMTSFAFAGTGEVKPVEKEAKTTKQVASEKVSIVKDGALFQCNYSVVIRRDSGKYSTVTFNTTTSDMDACRIAINGYRKTISQLYTFTYIDNF